MGGAIVPWNPYVDSWGCALELGGRGLWKAIRTWGGVFTGGFRTLTWVHREQLALSGKMKVCYDPGISHQDTKGPSAFILDTPALRTVRNKCLLLQVTQTMVSRVTVAERLRHLVKQERMGAKGRKGMQRRGTTPSTQPCANAVSATAASKLEWLEHQGWRTLQGGK